MQFVLCQLTEQLVTEGYKKMKASVSVDDRPGDHDDGYGQETAYLAMAKYCDSFLRLKEDGNYMLVKLCFLLKKRLFGLNWYGIQETVAEA